jgi:DNA-binding transcriptional MerR regulator
MTKENYKTTSEIADAVGLSRQAIYQYEEQGLIEPVIKTGTIRLYSGDTIDKVKEIQKLKKDYHLKAIKDIITKRKG